MILGDQAVVEIIIFDLQKNGFPIHIFPKLEEVHDFRGDEHTVGVYRLHGNEAKQTNEKQRNESVYIQYYTIYSIHLQYSRVASVHKYTKWFMVSKKKKKGM